MDDVNRPGWDILCFSSSDWEGVWGSRQQVMLRFAKRGHRILYVEQIAGWEHRLRHSELRQRHQVNRRNSLRCEAPNLWVITPPYVLPGRYYSRLVNKINGWIIGIQVADAMKALNISGPILWTYKPEHTSLIGNYHECLRVYHCIDEWAAGSHGRKRKIIEKMEEELLRKSDLVFANSPPTFAKKARVNPNTFRIPSGVDVEHFAQAHNISISLHSTIEKIPTPRIGYCGSINDRLDYKILETLAVQFPAYSFVYVGDTYPWPANTPHLQKLRSYPNVYFFGKYSYQELPSLIKGLQVGLLPYVMDERGYYRSPLKLYEYLAAGIPVVSTANPESCEASEVVFIAESPYEFVQMVEEALKQDNSSAKDKRIQYASLNSWDCRVEKMEEIIRKTLNNLTVFE
jgi:glycosyltransferase involved in cell wall biosynthesis